MAGLEVTENTWNTRTVLVTGATGLVGSWLCQHLVQLGADVVTLIRDLDPRSELLRNGTVCSTRVVSGRLELLEDLERAVVEHEVDTIFHLGAQTTVGAGLRSPHATFVANAAGTWNVLEVARRHRQLVNRIVVASTDKVYGEAETLPYTEDMPLRGRSPYDASKACADIVSQSYAGTFGLPIAIARCGNIYGGGDLNWSRLVPGTIRALSQGGRPRLRSDGKAVRDYIYVEDVVEAYLLLADSLSTKVEPGSAFNFSNEAPVSVLRMYQEICIAAGHMNVEPVIDSAAVHEISAQHLSAAKARDILGWAGRVERSDGLHRTVAWYQDFFARIGTS